MVLVTEAWSGLGSTIVGGFISAVVVLVGVLAERFLSDKRARTDEQRKAADDLIVDVSNLRDLATARKRGLRGEYELWPLRTRLYITQNSLRGLPAYSAAWAFYESAKEARDLARHAVRTLGDDHQGWPKSDLARFRAHLSNLDHFGDQVIELLQSNPESGHAGIPSRPTIAAP